MNPPTTTGGKDERTIVLCGNRSTLPLKNIYQINARETEQEIKNTETTNTGNIEQNDTSKAYQRNKQADMRNTDPPPPR